jgi:squalene synthase HpnC
VTALAHPSAGELALRAKASEENFPVALRLLPRRHREDLLAIYAFARLVDDLGDELDGDGAARLDALAAAEQELDRAFEGTATVPVFRRLSVTIERCRLPREPFAALIEANRMDQRVSRYQSFTDLLGYCALSADPVGQLVLHVFGELGRDPHRDAELSGWSHLVCSSLQIIEHLQDLAEDAAAGRVYLPVEDCARFSVDPEAPATWRDGAGRATAALRRLVAFECSRARSMLAGGEVLVGALGSWPAVVAVGGFAGGGHAQLSALERSGYDVLRSPVKASHGGVAAHTLAVLGRQGVASRLGRSREPRGARR